MVAKKLGDTPSSRIDQTANGEKIDRKTGKVTTKYKLAKRSKFVDLRVQAAAPCGSNCVVLNQENTRIAKTGIQLCHSFGRANSLEDDFMKSVEFAWGMTQNSLNLDSRHNCFYCVNHFHKMYDGGLWCFMPDIEVVKRYHAAMVRDNDDHGSELAKEILNDKDKIHSYTLVPILELDMKKIQIHVYNNELVQGPLTTAYEFPYDKLPKIRSHLHPKFVILSIGFQLTKTTNIPENYLEQAHLKSYVDAFKLIQELGSNWWRPLDPKKNFHPAFASKIPLDDIRKADKVKLGIQRRHSVTNLRSAPDNGAVAAPSAHASGRLRRSCTVANLKEAKQQGVEGSKPCSARSAPKPKVVRKGRRIAMVEDVGAGKAEAEEVKDGDESEDEVDDIKDLDYIPDTDDEGENAFMFRSRSNLKRAAESDSSSSDGSAPPSPTTQGKFSYASSSTAASTSSASAKKPSKKKIRRK
ncbi:hypothetical protein CVT24_001731 [Panaeolus cyanescens]|uniref:HNH nuclease domain-containing protein n=1 Tax=Panaeolus cyanescens TaxID=181874 RepID=A0A409YFQ4_9AGAR|nr:hypothetical protein CVT24_001731 [Panaeolus cyanescens]